MRGHCAGPWSLPFFPGTIPCQDFSICRFSPAPSAREFFGERRLSAVRETTALAHRANDMILWVKDVLHLRSWSASLATYVRWRGNVLSRSLSPPGSPVPSPLLRVDELSPTLEVHNAQIRNGN